MSGNNHGLSNSWEFDNLISLLQNTALADFWLPPLLFYRAAYGEERILEFLRKFENKFLGDWITRETPTARMGAMNAILKHIEGLKGGGETISGQIDLLLRSSLFDFNRGTFFRELDDTDLYGRRYARYLLYKLDMLFGGVHERLRPPNNMSVEHILPQNPAVGSQWCADFTDLQRDEWTDRLGNLVLISRSKNTSQGRLDYKEKVQRYFTTNIETFPNSLRALRRQTWTPADLQENHSEVMQKLRDYMG